MKKKIRYSEFTTPAPPPLTRFTPVASPAIESPATPAAPAPASKPRARRDSAPIELARALAQARASEATRAAETLAHVEARAAAAHARTLAAAEATAAEATAASEISEVAAAPESNDEDDGTPAFHSRMTATYSVTMMDDEAVADTEDVGEPAMDADELDEPRGPRRPLRERARNREGIAELLMFRIGTERFAVELACVEEAIDLPDVHHVPEMPPAMLGVITVRGALTPVFTPDTALGVPVQGKGAALIFRAERGRFALAIDDVDDVMTLDLALLRDAPGSDVADSVVLGVARNEGVIVALVDADALVLACQAIPAMELA
jgi:purine-binding chemotaxis protein CheW